MSAALSSRLTRRLSAFATGVAALLAIGVWVTPSWAQPGPTVEDDDVIVGTPWVGEMGITETVEEIAARGAAFDVAFKQPFKIKKIGMIDRETLPQNPLAPALSQWPPAVDDPAVLPEFPPQGGPRSPQTVGTNFSGASVTLYVPPDTMGAVGPTQIMVIVNDRVKLYSKTGVLGAIDVTLDSFFNSVRNGIGTSDPQVRYDPISQRWFVSCINVDYAACRVLIAVSSGPTITNTSSFTFYFFTQESVSPAGNTDQIADYPSLGIDNNALYIGANMFSTTTFFGASAWVVRKTSVLSGGPIVVSAFRTIMTSAGVGPYAPRGVDNPDATATEGYFVGVAGNVFSQLVMRRVSTPGGTPTMSGNINIAVSTTANPIDVPNMGSTSPLDSIDDRLFAAQIRRNRVQNLTTLWTAHNIQVNSSGVGSSSGGRNGMRWYELQTLTGTPTVRQSGTLFDSAATPLNFWMGSVAMSGQGHMALGCSRANSANIAGIAVAGRLRTDALGSTQAATVASTGTGNYNTGLQNGAYRWGDYSATFVDPTDDQTMWTFQQRVGGTNSWNVRALQLIAPPPATPTSSSPATIAQGASNVNLVITGTSISGSEFYDNDANYPQRLTAAFSGTGITVNSVTWVAGDPNSATKITLNVSVSGAAATGLRDLTVTNPDLQARSSAGGILTVTGGCVPPSITSNPSPTSACVGASAAFSVTASGDGPLSYNWRKNSVSLGAPNSPTLTINPVGAGDAGNYDCIVSGACAPPATSSAAALTVNTAPAITTNPTAQSACVGGSAVFTVAASGTGPLSYNWRKNTVSLGAPNSATLTINPVSAGSAGNYDCVVSGACSPAATSSAAALTVNTPPSIGTQPPPTYSACIGGTMTLTLSASGTGPLSYDWRKNTVSLGAPNSPTLTITPVSAATAGNYDCVVSGACSPAATSNTTAVTADPYPGDVDGDGDVDQDDMDIVLFNFGTSQPPGTNGDVDGDGDVDQDDMDIVLFNFGTSCP